MKKSQLIEKIKDEKLIAIVRGIESEKCLKVADALYEGGFRLVEITFDPKRRESWTTTAAAISAIKENNIPSVLKSMYSRYSLSGVTKNIEITASTQATISIISCFINSKIFLFTFYSKFLFTDN